MFKKIVKSVFLSIGSNLGDRDENLRMAVAGIRKEFECEAVESSVYETEPWGFRTEEQFLNMVVKIETDLMPEAILSKICSIEKSMGRVRNNLRYSSRNIDIDILFYGNVILSGRNLKIPHPLLHKRRFVLEPLSEIAADLIHPVYGKSVLSLLGSCIDMGSVSKHTLRRHPN